jgi:hypothetical protein
VRRIVHPIATLPYPPRTVAVPPRLATHIPGEIPDDLLEALCDDGSELEELCLDWWEFTPTQLEQLVTHCTGLRKLQIAVKASLMDIVSTLPQY